MSWIELSGPDPGHTSPGLRAYVARPSGPGPWPGVVALHEAWGLDEVMRRQVEHLASLGYLTIAPNLYADGGGLRCVRHVMRAIAAREGRAFADVEAARSWLLDQPDCTGRVGVIGFCMGGGFALVLADRGFDAASVNYGRLPGDLAVLAGACPIVGSYGGADRGLRGAAARLETALTAYGVPHDVMEYPSAGHSFLNDAPNGPAVLRPLAKVLGVGPHPAAAADAWRRIDAFFRTHLAGSPGAPEAPTDPGAASGG